MSLPFALQLVPAPRTYQVVTTSSVHMNQAQEQNTYYTTARQTLLQKKPNNTYLIRVEVLAFQSQNNTLFNQLAADLNQVSNDLLIQTDVYGRMERVVNKPALLEKWKNIKPGIIKKYKESFTREFFEAFEQNLRTGDIFEKSLRHKGLHGLLLPGIYGYGYVPQAAVKGQRVLEQFINHVALPLTTTTTLEPSKDTQVRALALQGVLNEDALAEDDLRRLFRTLADNVFLKVQLHVDCRENYTLETNTGWIKQAEQYLKAEIPGIYCNEVKHTLQEVTG